MNLIDDLFNQIARSCKDSFLFYFFFNLYTHTKKIDSVALWEEVKKEQ